MGEAPSYNQHYVVSILDDIVESAGPYFITGHQRFYRGSGSVSGPPFSTEDLSRLSTFIRTRDDRDRLLMYIFDRTSEETRLILHQIYTCDAILSNEQRTRLVLAVMVGMMAYYNDRAMRLELRRASNIANVLYAVEVAASDPSTRPLRTERVSLLTPAGPAYDFSNIAVFHFLRQA